MELAPTTRLYPLATAAAPIRPRPFDAARPADSIDRKDARTASTAQTETAHPVLNLPALRRTVDPATDTARPESKTEREPAQWPPRVRQAISAYSTQQSFVQLEALTALDQMLGIDDYA